LLQKWQPQSASHADLSWRAELLTCLDCPVEEILR